MCECVNVCACVFSVICSSNSWLLTHTVTFPPKINTINIHAIPDDVMEEDM